MGLEIGTFIDDLVATNPTGTDPKNQGDDHLRLIKTVIKITFPNATRAFRFPFIRTEESAYTILLTDENTLVKVDATTGPIIVTLPASAPKGFVVGIAKVDTTANAVTVAAGAGDTIDGYLTKKLQTQNDVVWLMGGAVTNWFSVGKSIAPRLQAFTSSGTYTKTDGLVSARVETVGAGGGGGGAQATSPSAASCGGCGGGGGYSMELLNAVSIGATETVTVGAGGAGGAAGQNDGATGGTSSFGTLLSATGGEFGTGGFNLAGSAATKGGAGGLGSGGDVNVGGSAGSNGKVVVGIRINVGVAGSTGLGGGAKYQIGETTPGNPGRPHGGGGSGASAKESKPAAAGGTGANGLILVWEFF